MKEKYSLNKAIKELYKVEPLRQDLVTIVADQVFTKQKAASTAVDKILLITLCLVIAISLIYGFRLLAEISVMAILLFVITIFGLIGLSIKEHFILLKQFTAEE